MISPMMVITTSISTSVNPACIRARLRRDFPRIPIARMVKFPLSNNLTDGKQRGHYRDDEATDDRADQDDCERPDHGNHPVKAALQLGLIELGDAEREHRELTCFLADSQHANRHWRHDRSCRQS